MERLKGKVVYLTGASHGIGRATALLLAEHLAQLAICGRSKAALEEVKRGVESAGAPKPLVMSFDLSIEEDILRFYGEAKRLLGPPDILINNAGFNPRKARIQDVGTQEFDSILSVNLRAPFILMREAARDMGERKSGHIVNVLSSVCHFNIERMGAYTAAKKGLQGLTDVFRKEVRPRGVRVSSIYPGGTDSNFRSERRPQYMRPESVAKAIVATLTLPEDLVVHQFTFRPMVEDNF
jgi:NAD(P)-dependent dehydrogenase (short-subunit alcohol dehydrogenase family)